MAKVSIPAGWCPDCNKKALDRVDVATDAEESLARLKKKLMTAFMIGDRDGALAEVSYQLGITPGELSVAGPWESPALTKEMARAIVDEILLKFPEVLEHVLRRSGIYDRMQREDEYRRRQDEYYANRMRNMDFMPRHSAGSFRPEDKITPAKREFYIPPYTVKKNER